MKRPSRGLTDAMLGMLTIGVVSIAVYAVQPVDPPTGSSAVRLAAAPTPQLQVPATSATVAPTVAPTPETSATPAALLVGRDLATVPFVSALGADLRMPATGVTGALTEAQLSDSPTLVVLQAPAGADAVPALTADLTTVQQASPKARIVVVGPLRRAEKGGPALRAAATSAGAAYLDPLAGKWLISNVGRSLTRAQRVKLAHRLAQELLALPG